LRNRTGRFAPSPTGPLHLGSLVCALASYLDARHGGGRWLVRMEDLDPPRESAGAARGILESLRSHGLNWDGEVLWQSRRHDAYATALAALAEKNLVFRCSCSRAQLVAAGGVYRGRCRDRRIPEDRPCAIRLRVEGDCRITVEDEHQQPLAQNLAAELGDFVIRRKDGFYAYQLAVVVDDAYQGVTHVLRGSDLYDSTPRQIYLQRRLGLATPVYRHIPVITNRGGRKLSKQTRATALKDGDALDNLRRALRFLGQKRPPASAGSVEKLLSFAVEHWDPAGVPAGPGIPEFTLY